MNRSGYRSLWAHPEYAALLCSQFLGFYNDNLFKMVVSLLAVSAAAGIDGGKYLSVIGAVFILPYLLFSGYAGHVADAFDKRNVVIAMKIAEIAIMGLAFVGLIAGDVFWLVAILFLMATQSTFFSPAKYGLLPEMLPTAQLSRANGCLELGRYVAVIIGSASAGLLLSASAHSAVLVGAVLLVVAGAGALVSLFVGSTGRSHASRPFRANPWAEIAGGIRRLSKHKRLGAVVAAITGLEALGSIVMLDLLLVGKEVMSLGDAGTSLMVGTAGIGIGAGCFLAGRLSGDRIELGLVPLAATGSAVTLLVLPFAIHSIPAMTCGVALVGMFGGLMLVPLNAFLQSGTDGREKGLIISTNNFLNMVGVLLSCVTLWLLRDRLAIPSNAILTVVAAATGVFAVGTLWLKPEWREAAISWLLIHIVYRVTVIGEQAIPEHGAMLLIAKSGLPAQAVVVETSLAKLGFGIGRPTQRQLGYLAQPPDRLDTTDSGASREETAVWDRAPAAWAGDTSTCLFVAPKGDRGNGNESPDIDRAGHERPKDVPIIPVRLATRRRAPACEERAAGQRRLGWSIGRPLALEFGAAVTR